MSNIFAGKETAKGPNVDEDYLGGGGPLDTDIYSCKIKTAYVQKASKSDAQSVNLILEATTGSSTREVRQQIWVSNRNGGVTYKDKKPPHEMKNLPGFSQINALCLLVAGKELGDMDAENLTVNIYDYDAKKELPQSVVCFTELHGEMVNVALQKQTIDKTQLNESSGKYDATGETRDINEIVKFFAADKLITISELTEYITSLGGNLNDAIANGDLVKAIAAIPEERGNYGTKWLEANQGQTYVKAKGGKAGAGVANAATPSPATAATALFD